MIAYKTSTAAHVICYSFRAKSARSDHFSCLGHAILDFSGRFAVFYCKFRFLAHILGEKSIFQLFLENLLYHYKTHFVVQLQLPNSFCEVSKAIFDSGDSIVLYTAKWLIFGQKWPYKLEKKSLDAKNWWEVIFCNVTSIANSRGHTMQDG